MRLSLYIILFILVQQVCFIENVTASNKKNVFSAYSNQNKDDKEFKDQQDFSASTELIVKYLQVTCLELKMTVEDLCKIRQTPIMSVKTFNRWIQFFLDSELAPYAKAELIEQCVQNINKFVNENNGTILLDGTIKEYEHIMKKILEQSLFNKTGMRILRRLIGLHFYAKGLKDLQTSYLNESLRIGIQYNSVCCEWYEFFRKYQLTMETGTRADISKSLDVIRDVVRKIHTLNMYRILYCCINGYNGDLEQLSKKSNECLVHALKDYIKIIMKNVPQNLSRVDYYCYIFKVIITDEALPLNVKEDWIEKIVKEMLKKQDLNQVNRLLSLLVALFHLPHHDALFIFPSLFSQLFSEFVKSKEANLILLDNEFDTVIDFFCKYIRCFEQNCRHYHYNDQVTCFLHKLLLIVEIKKFMQGFLLKNNNVATALPQGKNNLMQNF